MRNRSISSIKRANGNDSAPSEGVGRIVVDNRVFIVVLAPQSPPRLVPGQTCRFKIDEFEFAAIETLDQQRREANEIASRLTGRELEIAVLVARRCATKNIAFRLWISEWTAATYLRRIFAKLDVSSRAAMVYRCAPLIDRVISTSVKTLDARGAVIDRLGGRHGLLGNCLVMDGHAEGEGARANQEQKAGPRGDYPIIRGTHCTLTYLPSGTGCLAVSPIRYWRHVKGNSV